MALSTSAAKSRKGSKPRHFFRIAAVGIAAMLLTGYILLAAGLLGEMPGRLVGLLASGNGTDITFIGLRTDIFWSTNVDTVIVADTTGLVVTVAGVDVRGSGLGYLLSHHVRSLEVESLDLSLPSEGDSLGPPQTLDSLLTVIEESIVAGVDRFQLKHGIIYDPMGVIVDSIYLDTRIDRGSRGVYLSIDSLTTILPGFGRVSASGTAGLDSGLLTAADLRAFGPPGNVTVTGSLEGSTSLLDASLSGQAGTSFLGLPLDLDLSFEGTVTGTLAAPSASMSFSRGDAFLFGRCAEVQADSVYADLGRITIAGLLVTTDQASLHIDGDLDIETMMWSGEIIFSMNEVDPSSTWEALPPGSVTGTIHVSGAGSADTLLQDISASVDLYETSLDNLRISSLHLNASILRGWFLSDCSVHLENESASFSCAGPLNGELLPISLTASATASISSSSVFEKFGLQGLPEVRSVTVDFTGSGSGFDEAMMPGNWSAQLEVEAGSVSGISTSGLGGIPGMTGTSLTLSGSGTSFGGTISPEVLDMRLETHLGSLNLGSIEGIQGNPVIDGTHVSVSGHASDFGADLMPGSWTAHAGVGISGVTGNGLFGLEGFDRIDEVALQIDGNGSRFAASAEGAVSIDSVVLGGILLDSASVQGSMAISRGDLSGHVDISMDSLRIGEDAYRLGVGIDYDGNDITADSLLITTADGRLYSASIAVRTGLLTRFSVGDMRASYSKHRMITDGALSGFTENGVLVLDTLWFNPPVGVFGMSGLFGPDSTSINADVDHFDFSTLRSLVGLPSDMSGVGTFAFRFQEGSETISGSFTGTISDPVYGQFRMDSVTVDITMDYTGLTVNGIYAWLNGVRSGLQLKASGMWDAGEIDLTHTILDWVELEVNDIGDWLFYVLPLPVRTVGASVSARVEYDRTAPEGQDLEIQASARIDKLFITMLGIELPRVNFYLNYPDSSRAGFNSRFTLGAGDIDEGNFSAGCYAWIEQPYPLDLGDYDVSISLDEMGIPLPGIGAVEASGDLSSSGSGISDRPLLSGDISILGGAVGIPQASGTSSEGSSELPFDMAIDIDGSNLWFRTSFADIELVMKLRVLTLEEQPTVNGVISAVRGRITLLQTDFDITEGRVELIQGIPPQVHLNVVAQTTVRSLMNQERYDITVRITGDADNPEVNMTGVGPSGTISQEDILTLLAVGVTYGEMQQLNSSALRSEVENVAQSLVGNLIARSIRHEIGLDTFQISPELFADTTSLVLNVGKYVLPNVYVSYKGDVFSPSPGTFSLQYLFSSDFYIEGTSRSTIHGDLEPTLELHYTIHY